jgi:hypothetical protein
MGTINLDVEYASGDSSLNHAYCYDGWVIWQEQEERLRFCLEVWRGKEGETRRVPPAEDPWGLLDRFSLEEIYNPVASEVKAERLSSEQRYHITFWINRTPVAIYMGCPEPVELEDALDFTLTALQWALHKEYVHLKNLSP